MFHIVISNNVSCDLDSFMRSLHIWIHRPNVCCKAISCACVEELEKSSIMPDIDILKKEIFDEVVCKSCEENNADLNVKYDGVVSKHRIFLRELVPRNSTVHLSCHEAVVVQSNSVIFIPLTHNFELDHELYWYKLEYCKIEEQSRQITDKEVKEKIKLSKIRLLYKSSTDTSSEFPLKKSCRPNKQWIKDKLLTSIVKWANEENSPNSKQTLPISLSLIDQREYAGKYQYLKQKYGAEMIKIWSEVTDPQKYVYEDVAIATYLLLLWKKERETVKSVRLQSFIDLGCGNGLLVHILNSEGHPGKGIDLRKRSIWDVYPETTHLVEGIIDPTSNILYSNYDWLLGNHSDELTPWIPVLASRSGYNVRYWVLPCCFFDFFTKYKRSQSTLGQYDDYLKFVETVGKICGFDVDIDVMRIPSTKRVCQVGMKKTYLNGKHQEILENISQYIDGRLSVSVSETLFVPRDREEKIQNCTKIARSSQDSIVNIIVDKLLSITDLIEITVDEKPKNWNRGGKIFIEDAISLIPSDLRNLMKNECGGLQTLLRNHHQIFEVSQGELRLRDWSNTDARPRRKKKSRNGSIKTKPCWFYNNHPDGCPLSDKNCSFLHESCSC